MNKSLKSRKSFTLIELILATMIFTFLIVSASTVFVQIMRAHQRNNVENYLVTESRYLMERIVREIRKGTVDYEEYYSKDPDTLNASEYGLNYGSYAKQFFDPGTRHDGDTDVYGYNCNGGSCSNPEDITQSTIDNEIGTNPYNGTNVDSYTAVTKNSASAIGDYRSSNLYLISSSGREKTYFIYSGTQLSLLKMTGDDTDQNGVVDKWNCADGFGPGAEADKIEDDDFVNITPNDIEIVALKFSIHPLEDPYKAFAEPKSERFQPRITINMILEPKEQGVITDDNEPTIEVQTTVSSQVYYNLPSYSKFCDNGGEPPPGTSC
jgi:type II secretory pathway pseudopilin PulG